MINSQYIVDTLLSSDHLRQIAVSAEVVTMKQKVRIKVTHDKELYNVSHINHNPMSNQGHSKST